MIENKTLFKPFKWLYLTIFFAGLPLVQAGERIAIHLGGGGSPNIFAQDFQASKSRLKEAGFSQVRSYYAGGEPSSVGADGTFSEESMEKLIDELSSKEYEKDSQLLLIIQSHGSTELSDEIHCVQVTETICWPVSRLKRLRDALTQKGVQVGIVDLSCHSGTTQELADQNTCVISLASHEEPALNTTIGHFWNTLPSMSKENSWASEKYGQNLEGLYLGMRMTGRAGRDLPRISTPTGKKLTAREEHLYGTRKVLQPFSVFGDISGFGNIARDLKKVGYDQFGFTGLSDYSSPSCLHNPYYDSSIENLGSWLENINGYQMEKNIDRAIREYQNARSYLMNSIEIMEKKYGNLSDDPPIIYNGFEIKPSLLLALPEHAATLLNSTQMQVDHLKKQIATINTEISNYDSYKASLEKNLEKAEKQLEAIRYFEKNPSHVREAAGKDVRTKSYYHFYDQLQQDINSIQAAAEKIQEANNRAFVQEYQNRANKDQEENACTDFKF